MPQSRKQQCWSDLRARILSQDIPPGSDLDEMTLCETYGISRTPLREILHRLAGDGFVSLENNRGAKVASMDLAVLRTFFQTAPLIYSSIARLAAENRTRPELDALTRCQGKFATAARKGHGDQAALQNHQFHEQIGQMAKNPYLQASLNRMLIDHTRLSQTFFRPRTEDDAQRVEMAIQQHDAMISAIEAQDPSLASDLTLQHWDLSRDRMEHYVRPDPLPLEVAQPTERRHAV